jgi:hypothetical protein
MYLKPQGWSLKEKKKKSHMVFRTDNNYPLPPKELTVNVQTGVASVLCKSGQEGFLASSREHSAAARCPCLHRMRNAGLCWGHQAERVFLLTMSDIYQDRDTSVLMAALEEAEKHFNSFCSMIQLN